MHLKWRQATLPHASSKPSCVLPSSVFLTFHLVAQTMKIRHNICKITTLDIGWSSAGTEDVVVADIIQLLPSTIEKVELVDELRRAELISCRPGTYDNVP